MMHLHLRTDADSYRGRPLRHVTEAKLWVGLRSAPSELGRLAPRGLAVGDATLDFAPSRSATSSPPSSPQPSDAPPPLQSRSCTT